MRMRLSTRGLHSPFPEKPSSFLSPLVAPALASDPSAHRFSGRQEGSTPSLPRSLGQPAVPPGGCLDVAEGRGK